MRCNTRAVILAVALAGGVALASCTATQEAPDSLPVTTLYQSQHCGQALPTLNVLSSDAEWDILLTRLHSTNPLGPAPDIAQPPQGKISVLVAWGQQPTGAHALALSSDHAPVSNGTVALPIDFLKPKTGRIASQVLVSPCVVLSLPDTGTYSRIKAGPLSTTR